MLHHLPCLLDTWVTLEERPGSSRTRYEFDFEWWKLDPRTLILEDTHGVDIFFQWHPFSVGIYSCHFRVQGSPLAVRGQVLRHFLLHLNLGLFCYSGGSLPPPASYPCSPLRFVSRVWTNGELFPFFRSSRRTPTSRPTWQTLPSPVATKWPWSTMLSILSPTPRQLPRTSSLLWRATPGSETPRRYVLLDAYQPGLLLTYKRVALSKKMMLKFSNLILFFSQ